MESADGRNFSCSFFLCHLYIYTFPLDVAVGGGRLFINKILPPGTFCYLDLSHPVPLLLQWLGAMSHFEWLTDCCADIKWPWINSSPPEQNGRRFADDIFRCIFVNEKFCIFIKISLKFAPNGPIDNNPALVQIVAWCRIGDKPLSEPMLTQFTDAYKRH